eukprot:353839-Chlamydomonas_euryale.AAC.34
MSRCTLPSGTRNGVSTMSPPDVGCVDSSWPANSATCRAMRVATMGPLGNAPCPTRSTQWAFSPPCDSTIASVREA